MTLNPSSREKFQKMRRVSERPRRKPVFILFLALFIASTIACKIDERQSGIPTKAQEIIDAFTEDFNAARYKKIYEEAGEQWRGSVTLEQSNEIFIKLRERLGPIKERTYTSGRQQRNPSENLPANSLVIRYNTRFESAEGMETFTLIEGDGRYWLAGYSVSSDLLK